MKLCKGCPAPAKCTAAGKCLKTATKADGGMVKKKPAVKKGAGVMAKKKPVAKKAYGGMAKKKK